MSISSLIMSSFLSNGPASFDTLLRTILPAALPPACRKMINANTPNANSDANAASPPDNNQLGTIDKAPAPASPAATNSVSATSPTPATLSLAADNMASVAASPTSKSSVPDRAVVIADDDPSVRTEEAIPVPSNDDEPISLATIPAPPIVVVVALDEAIVPNAVALLATLRPAAVDPAVAEAAAAAEVAVDEVVAVDVVVAAIPEAAVVPPIAAERAAAIVPPDAAILPPDTAAVVVDVAVEAALVVAVVTAVTEVTVDDEDVVAAIPDAAVPPIAADRAAAIDPPDVAAILPPDRTAVVDVEVAALVVVTAVVVAAIPPPSDSTTAPPTAAAAVPTAPTVLVELSLLTDAKKNGDSFEVLSASLFCFLFAQRIIRLHLVVNCNGLNECKKALQNEAYASNRR
mmetsp:Transcript_29137/g.47259  ORF Transcript_29137/g.47259 Transcript_29137/m.47259 type:complete len:404 (+) Transcript_29137:320-1531(+)